ncbi:MAG: helix-turn-helix domain-containing protein [bacterium]|nr:helix-turn-helix domain-containing protein [bacterium]
MTIVVYIGIAQAFFLSALLLTKSGKKVFDYILLTWLILNAIQLYYFNLSFEKITDQYNQSILIVIGLLPYLVAPLLFFYVSALVKPRKFELKNYTYHFLPFLVVTSTMLYYHFFREDVEIWVVDGFIHLRGKLPFILTYYALIMAFFSFLYPAICLHLLFKHRARIENEFSYHEKVTLSWLRHWILLEIIGFWISFLIVWAGEFEWVGFLFSFKVIAIVIIFNIVVIGFFGIRQRAIFTNLPVVNPPVEESNNKSKYEKSAVPDNVLVELTSRLEELMNKDKPYLNPKLDIDSLAQLADTRKHYLSQALNDQLKINFYDYVNGFRVEEFKNRSVDPSNSHLSILGIALDCGFNSKSSFNSIFKKREGLTPSEFKKNMKSNTSNPTDLDE